MGYYIEVPGKTGKTKQLMELYGARLVLKPSSLNEIPLNQALICVVRNGPYDAAAFCYSESELEAFSHSLGDSRPRQWLLMDLAKVKELTGYMS